MKIVDNVSKNEVYLAWLRSERYKIDDLTEEELRLITDPNTLDQTENSKRESLLLEKFKRNPILSALPDNIHWSKVVIEEIDLEKIHIIACLDWFLDTGRSFKLPDVKSNLSSGRGHSLSGNPPFEDHKKKVDQILSSLASKPGDIIMITINVDSGPYTIIDGTHRASSLLLRDSLHGAEGYLGLSGDLSSCRWTQEWVNFQAMNQELNHLANQGVIW